MPSEAVAVVVVAAVAAAIVVVAVAAAAVSPAAAAPVPVPAAPLAVFLVPAARVHLTVPPRVAPALLLTAPRPSHPLDLLAHLAFPAHRVTTAAPLLPAASAAAEALVGVAEVPVAAALAHPPLHVLAACLLRCATARAVPAQVP